MPTSYPGGIDNFTDPGQFDDLGDLVGGRYHDEHHADLNAAVEAIQTELGTDPAGTEATVKARLEAIEASGGVGEIDAGLFSDRMYMLNVDQGGSVLLPADIIVVNIIANGAPVRVKDLIVWVTTDASAQALVEVALYDASDRTKIDTWGTFDMDVSPGNVTLTRGSTILLPPTFVIAAKLRSSSNNGGTYRAGLSFQKTFQHVGNPWDGLDSSFRGQTVADSGTGALPSTLPSTGWSLGASQDQPPALGFRPWT